jgi:hypothetical protein
MCGFLATSIRPNCESSYVETVCVCAGLSGAVYTSLYVGFLQPDTLAFLVFIAVVPTAVALVAACFVNSVPFTQDKEVPAHTSEALASCHIPDPSAKALTGRCIIL